MTPHLFYRLQISISKYWSSYYFYDNLKGWKNMIILKNSEDDIITKVHEGYAIDYHNQRLINPEMHLEKGQSVMLFTQDNLDEFRTYYKDKMMESLMETLETQKELLKMMEDFIIFQKKTDIKIKELIRDNENLKQFNAELTRKLLECEKGRLGS